MELSEIIIELMLIGILLAMLINLFDELKETKKLKIKRRCVEEELQKLKERGL